MCEWCGRPFLLRDQRHGERSLWTIGALLCLLLVAVVALLAFLNSPWPPARAAPPTSTPMAEPTEEPAVQPTVVPSPEPEPTVEPAEYVRVANTGGIGVVLRREPSIAAPRVVARAENTLLRVVGPDQVVDGRVWRHVEDAQGNRGWTPAEFLTPAAPPGA